MRHRADGLRPARRHAGGVPRALPDDPRLAARGPVPRPPRDPPLRGGLRLHPPPRSRALPGRAGVEARLRGAALLAGGLARLPADLGIGRCRGGGARRRRAGRRRGDGGGAARGVRRRAGRCPCPRPAGGRTRRLGDVRRRPRSAQEPGDGRGRHGPARLPRHARRRRRLSRALAAARAASGRGAAAAVPRPCRRPRSRRLVRPRAGHGRGLAGRGLLHAGHRGDGLRLPRDRLRHPLPPRARDRRRGALRALLGRRAGPAARQPARGSRCGRAPRRAAARGAGALHCRPRGGALCGGARTADPGARPARAARGRRASPAGGDRLPLPPRAVRRGRSPRAADWRNARP